MKLIGMGLILVGLCVGIGMGLGLGMAEAAQDETPNCKLSIRTRYKTGKVKVDVEEVHAGSRAACKQESKKRENVQGDEGIESIRVSYGWRPE